MGERGLDLGPGSFVDRYELLSLIGSGGFGVVFRARHTVLGQAVAVKLLLPEHVESADIVARFFQEARAAAAVGSPHIVRVIDCAIAEGQQPFIVMELLDGTTLEQLLAEEKRFDVDRALGIAFQTLDGLAAAHTAGIVHRDLKPANIFLVRDGDTGGDFVKLLDFGISKFRRQGTPSITRTGSVMGTPLYMAPEQMRGTREVDHRADVYSAAAVLYRMLAGTEPHEGIGYEDMVVRVCTEPPRPLAAHAPEVPAAIAMVIERGLARDPDGRYSSAEHFAFALREAGAGRALPERGTARGTQPMTPPPTGASHRGPDSGIQERTPSGPLPPTFAGPPTPHVGGMTPSIAVLHPSRASGPLVDPGATRPEPSPPVADRGTSTGPLAHDDAARLAMHTAYTPAPASGSTYSGPRSVPPGSAASSPSSPGHAAATPAVLAGAAAVPSVPARKRRFLWLALAAPIAALVAAGVVIGVLHLVDTRPGGGAATVPPVEPVQTGDDPGVSGKPPEPEKPEPTAEDESPFVPTPSMPELDIDPEMLEGPAAGEPPGDGYRYAHTTVGQADLAGLHNMIQHALPPAIACATPGRAHHVRIQIFLSHVDPRGVAMIQRAPDNPGSPEVASCVAETVARSLPAHNNTGTGITRVDVWLPAR